MSNQYKTPTMKDVAREAGVALGTVSKVFNGIPVGESYRKKVEAAAEKLGYTVNVYARGLRASKTRTVALIIPMLKNLFHAEFADHICHELTERDYRLMIATTQFDGETEARCIQMVVQNKVDGIIGLTYAADLNIPDALPYVSIDRFIRPDIPCVASDNFRGGFLAAEKLIQLGCKRPLFLRVGSEVLGETDKRGFGFTAACEAMGVDCVTRRFDELYGHEPALQYLEAHIHGGRLDFDGIFCSTDRLVYFVRRLLNRHGIRVPEDVQLIGYDGARAFFTEAYTCSTIVQPIRQMAETAVDLLLNQERPQSPALICLPVTYAPGGTTRE